MTSSKVEGFAIVEQPEKALRAYASEPTATKNREMLARLRRALHPLDPSRYRGISRNPVDALKIPRFRLSIDRIS